MYIDASSTPGVVAKLPLENKLCSGTKLFVSAGVCSMTRIGTEYAEYLHKLTKDTQFIVITHRRGTMNAADILYGITMQEKGVSTLVSVNLLDEKEIAN